MCSDMRSGEEAGLEQVTTGGLDLPLLFGIDDYLVEQPSQSDCVASQGSSIAPTKRRTQPVRNVQLSWLETVYAETEISEDADSAVSSPGSPNAQSEAKQSSHEPSLSARPSQLGVQEIWATVPTLIVRVLARGLRRYCFSARHRGCTRREISEIGSPTDACESQEILPELG